MFSFLCVLSTNVTVGWQPEPTTRGTFNILSSCIITTSLCVWRAVHHNIPSEGEKRAQVLRKVGWLLVGLVAPEMVVFTAWYQRSTAKAISKEIERTELAENVSSTLFTHPTASHDEQWLSIQVDSSLVEHDAFLLRFDGRNRDRHLGRHTFYSRESNALDLDAVGLHRSSQDQARVIQRPHESRNPGLE